MSSSPEMHSHSHSQSPKRPHSPDETGARKRVGKACDRCRLKKSKCDGLLPCQRCLADDQICVFSERKRAKDKVYPKGYVELLESRTQTLVDALHRVLYCQQQQIDISHLIPSNGKIVLNEVLAHLESSKKIPTSAVGEAYTDDLLENFVEEQQRSRQDSTHSCPELHSGASSGDEDSPHSPIGTITPDFTFDGQYLSQALQSKMPYFDQTSSMPQSIAPAMFMPDYTFSQSPLDLDLDYGLTSDQLLSEPTWY